MPASGAVHTGSEQHGRGTLPPSIGRRIVALLRRVLCNIACWAAVISFLLVPIMLLTEATLDDLPALSPLLIVAAVSWSVGRMSGGSLSDGWGDNPLMWCFFEANARASERPSLPLVWLATLLDGALMAPRAIALLVVGAFGAVVWACVLIWGVAVIAVYLSAILAAIAVVGFIFWWVGCAFFITCS